MKKSLIRIALSLFLAYTAQAEEPQRVNFAPHGIIPASLAAQAIPTHPAVLAARDRALTERPDLKAARLRTQQDNAQVRLASAQRTPDLVASIRYARELLTLENLPAAGGIFHDRDNLIAFGISIPLPFRNRNQGNIQAAAAAERASRQDASVLTAEVARDVSAAHASFRASEKARDIFRRDVFEQSQKNLEVIREAYRLGQLRLLDVLNEQRKTFDLELVLVQSERELALAAAALETSVGRSLGLLP